MPTFEPKKLVKKLPGLRSGGPELTAEDVAPAREYIHKYWSKLTRENKKDNDSLIGLPNPYLVPAFERGHEFDFNEMYYSDSYFMAQGIMDAQHKNLVIGMLDNLIFMQKRFGIIPNASRTYLMGRSQPPYLSSFIMDVYRAYKLDKKWLANAMAAAKDEYFTVWMGMSKPNARQVFHGLSRFYDINYLHDLAEAESGWDMTPRFNRKALDYIPVDLNSLLYKYETDFSEASAALGEEDEAIDWRLAAKKRRQAMNRFLWNELRGFYFDYNYVKRKKAGIFSLAGYYPMWAGAASDKQAARLVKNLRRFEQAGGLSTTDSSQLGQLLPGATPTQWAYPNGWAPLHFIVVKGLQRYGYDADARRIAMKWLKSNLDWFDRHHVFLEKYNVVQPKKPPMKGVYPSQTGFGWTNSVFELFCQEFIDSNTPRSLLSA